MQNTLSAQSKLWMHNKDRFGAHQMLDLTDVDSVTFDRMKMVFYKSDGTWFRRTYASAYDYYTFHDPGLGLYKPNEFRTMNFDDEGSQWCFARSQESKHFIVFWDAGFGNNPRIGKGTARFNPDVLLENAEFFFDMYTDSLGFAPLESSRTVNTYKLEIFVNSKPEWLATGSGYDDKIGALWCNYSAVNNPSTLAHEIGHSFQYIVSCDLGTDHGWRYGFGENASGGCAWWESCAQWQAFRCYPKEKFGSWFNFQYFHLNLLHEEWRYNNFFIQDYWCMLHGGDFIGRMWRESQKPEDPVETYQRLTGVNQQQFNDEIYEYAARSATWDFDDIRHLGVQQMHHSTNLNIVDASNVNVWQVDADQCPQNYGYNIIPLTIRPSGTEIKARFRGIAGADGYRSLKVENAGWRYGFVALSTDGTRTYGQVNRDSVGIASFVVPANAERLWFVVSGAPKVHWRHPWNDNVADDEQWPYQVSFEQTDREGYFVVTGEPEDVELNLVANISYAESGTLYSIVPINYDIIAQAFKLPVDSIRKSTNNPDDVLCTFGQSVDGVIQQGTTSNMYCFKADGSLIDYSADDDSIVIYASHFSFYNGLYIMVNSSVVHPGDAYEVRIGICYKAEDGEVYKATCVVKVNIIA